MARAKLTIAAVSVTLNGQTLTIGPLTGVVHLTSPTRKKTPAKAATKPAKAEGGTTAPKKNVGARGKK